MSSRRSASTARYLQTNRDQRAVRPEVVRACGVVGTRLDGVNVGVTPLEQDVAPGSHSVALQRDDATLGRVTIDTKAGDITEVKVPIAEPMVTQPGATAAPHQPPPPESVPPSEGRAPSRIVPGLLIALGTGAVLTGAVFVYYGHKNGPDDPLIYPDATKQGAIVAGVGGAVLITGLVLWWHGSASAANVPRSFG